MTDEDTAIDAAQVARGRSYLLVAVGFLVFASVVTIIVYIVRLGPGQITQQLGRLAVTLVLGFFLLQGRAWARWLLLAFLLAGLWVALGIILRPGAFAGEHLTVTLPLLVMYVGYAVIARGLIYSDDVRAFFRAHRRPSGT
jgi:hypothetical protein